MKRMLLAVVAAGLLWAASPARSDAQFRYDPSFPCGDCVGGGAGDYFPQGVHLGIAWSSPANMNPWLYRAFETGLLIHVNPLMFLPVADPGSLIEERCDPNEDGVFSHILLEAKDANAGNALFGVGVNSDAGLSGCCGHEHSAVDIKQTQREGWTFGIGVNSDCGHDGSFALYGKAAFNRMPIIFSSQSAAGFTCPHLMRSFQLPVVTFPVTPFDARSNLNNLLVAGNILRHGEELIDHGLFMDALRCFQQVHDLVPGTNLEGRANLDTQELLVRVYGTDDEKGAVEEQSTPDTPAPDPSLSPGMLVPPPPVIFKSAKATTVVYPVVELLGKDKETKLDDLDELVQVITSTIEPNSWAEAGGAGKIDYYYRSRALVIRQTAEVHEQVGDLLAALLRTKQQCEEGMEPDESTPAGNHTAKTTAKCEHCCPACSTMGVCCADCRETCCGECIKDKSQIVPANATNVAEEESDAWPENESECEPAVAPIPMQLSGRPEWSAPEDFNCFEFAMHGVCLDVDMNQSGWRLLWQMPLGPLTVRMNYEKNTFTVTLPSFNSRDFADEESECTGYVRPD